MGSVLVPLLFAIQQIALPPPRGYVNDFAAVLDPASVARVGRIRDAMTPYLAREDYSAGLAHGVDLIAQAFAQQFGVTLSGQPPPPPADHSDRLPIPLAWLIGAAVLLIILTRGRVLLLPFYFGATF